jgi:outer membrane lipoprotein LolB
LALTVPSNAQENPQAYFAGFELSGNAGQGQMRLLSPLGQTLASLHWSPQGARLEKGDEVRLYDSVAAMTEALTGQALPLQALFDWLEGRATPVSGWDVDLSAQAAGKITAKRRSPPAELKLILTP